MRTIEKCLGRRAARAEREETAAAEPNQIGGVGIEF